MDDTLSQRCTTVKDTSPADALGEFVLRHFYHFFLLLSTTDYPSKIIIPFSLFVSFHVSNTNFDLHVVIRPLSFLILLLQILPFLESPKKIIWIESERYPSL